MLAEYLLKKVSEKKVVKKGAYRNTTAVTIKYQGDEYTVSELAEYLGTSTNTLRNHIKKGLPEEEWGKSQRTGRGRGTPHRKG